MLRKPEEILADLPDEVDTLALLYAVQSEAVEACAKKAERAGRPLLAYDIRALKPGAK